MVNHPLMMFIKAFTRGRDHVPSRGFPADANRVRSPRDLLAAWHIHVDDNIPMRRASPRRCCTSFAKLQS